MGSAIKNSDGKIFDDVDINEALPDWCKINTKRKELLLEFSNIFPYTGAFSTSTPHGNKKVIVASLARVLTMVIGFRRFNGRFQP